MINVILQSLGLDLVNINVPYANVYQNIPNGLRVVVIFRELSGTSQIDRGRKRAIIRHTERQPSAFLSVDFLWVVQFSVTLLKCVVFVV